MKIEMDLSSFNKEKSSEYISEKVKNAVLNGEKALIVIEEKDGVSIIPKGDFYDLLAIMVTAFSYINRLYRVDNVDGVLECFVKNVKSTFNENGD